MFNKGNTNARKGMLWLVNKKIIEEFNAKYTIITLNEKISIMKLKIYSTNINIVGIYLPSLNSCTDDEYKLDLMQLQNIINKECKPDDTLIIVGDWNADPGRKDGLADFQNAYSTPEYHLADFRGSWKYKRDKIMMDHLEENNLTNISSLNVQLCNYTLKKRENIESSRLDHIILNEASCRKLEYVQSNIICSPEETKNLLESTGTKHMGHWDNLYNQGDHRAVQIKIGTRINPKTNICTQNSDKNFDEILSIRWYDYDIVESYNIRLWYLFQTNEMERLIQEEGNGVLVTDLLFESITGSINGTKSEYYRKSKFIKNKPWWDTEMKNLKEQRSHWYHLKQTAKPESDEYTQAETKYNYYKKVFKVKQNEKIFMMENINCQKLNKLHQEDCTKIRFWRHNKSMGKAKQEKVEVPIDKLADMYEDLFNTNIVTNNSIDENALNISNIEFESHARNSEKMQVSEKHISDLLDHELANNKAPGHKRISNEAFKNIDFITIIFILKYIFEEFFNFNRIANYFNTGMITLLIKDKKKASDDMNNLRPIMLSDVLANLLEKLFLKLMSPWIKLSKYQFGFRENHSCLHAIVMARETILDYMARGKPVYGVAELYASYCESME